MVTKFLVTIFFAVIKNVSHNLVWQEMLKA